MQRYKKSAYKVAKSAGGKQVALPLQTKSIIEIKDIMSMESYKEVYDELLNSCMTLLHGCATDSASEDMGFEFCPLYDFNARRFGLFTFFAHGRGFAVAIKLKMGGREYMPVRTERQLKAFCDLYHFVPATVVVELDTADIFDMTEAFTEAEVYTNCRYRKVYMDCYDDTQMTILTRTNIFKYMEIEGRTIDIKNVDSEFPQFARPLDKETREAMFENVVDIYWNNSNRLKEDIWQLIYLAQHGDVYARRMLYDAYRDGRGVDRDYNMMRLVAKSRYDGLPEDKYFMQTRVEELYYGLGCEQDCEAAKRIFVLLDEWIDNRLKIAAYNCVCPPGNYKEFLESYTKASKAGFWNNLWRMVELWNKIDAEWTFNSLTDMLTTFNNDYETFDEDAEIEENLMPQCLWVLGDLRKAISNGLYLGYG